MKGMKGIVGMPDQANVPDDLDDCPMPCPALDVGSGRQAVMVWVTMQAHAGRVPGRPARRTPGGSEPTSNDRG